jgi:prevent-host-death family protein
MKKVALSELKGDLSKFLRMAEKEGIVITPHGKPAGVLLGFADEDDWFDYCLENDPRFLKRIAAARENLRAGSGVHVDDVVWEQRKRQVPAYNSRCLLFDAGKGHQRYLRLGTETDEHFATG